MWRTDIAGSDRVPGRQSGFNLLEIVVALALLGLVAVVGVPPLLELYKGLRVKMAAQEIAGALHAARSYAVRHNQHVAVKFRTDPNGIATYSLYRDGNGNGVRNKDIERKTDPAVWRPRPLHLIGGKIRLGFPAGVVPRHPSNPSRRMDRLDDPIRFNRSDLAAFTPLGTATPGSIYITDGDRHLMAVRTYDRTGKIRFARYDLEAEVWR